jgi:transposase
MLVEPLLDSMPAIKRGGRGHPRRRPVKLHGDKGYDNPRVRRYRRRRGITARIARLGRDSSAHLGRHRWVVERTPGWLLSYKRLALRYDHSASTVNAFARLAVTRICARRLPANCCNVFLRTGESQAGPPPPRHPIDSAPKVAQPIEGPCAGRTTYAGLPCQVPRGQEVPTTRSGLEPSAGGAGCSTS